MSQSLAKVYLHYIFSTKNREPLVDKSWREELFEVLGGAASSIQCPPLLVGGTADHVHILCQLSRTLSISNAVGKIKSSSSNWVNKSSRLKSDFHWQAGYGAFSVSQSNVETVREYIRRQEEHHARTSFQDEFREFLRRHEMEWDERYVWD